MEIKKDKFIKAAKEKNYTYIDEYLKAKGNINYTTALGTSALMWAAVRGSYKIAKTLLEANADINAKNNNGETALSMLRKHVNDHEDYAKVFYLLKSATEKGAK